MRRAPLVALAGLCACPPPSSQDPYILTTAQPDSSDSSGPAGEADATASASTGAAPTSGEPGSSGPPDPSGAPSTGGTTTTTTGFDPPDVTTTSQPNAPPEILSLYTIPAVIDHAGVVELVIEATDDATLAKIEFAGVAEEVKLDGTPTHFPFDVTSQETCAETKFDVTVFDDDSLTDHDVLGLDCQMPQSGSEVYTATLDGTSAADVALLDDGGALVAGVKGGRMTLWALDAAGQVRVGWPKTIGTWSLDPKYDTLTSWATTVARDSLGRIYVGGVVKDLGGLRRYVARLTPTGGLMWEDLGTKLGEEIEGIAVTSDDVAVAVGSIRTSPPNDTPYYDMGIWGYPPNFPQVQGWSDVFSQPETDPWVSPENKVSELGRDAVALPGGGVIVLGERRYHLEKLVSFQRATWQRYASDGARIGAPWTSDGFKFKHDAARSGAQTKDGFALIGWGQHEPDLEQQVLIQRFDLAGKQLGVQHESSAAAMLGEGISPDREHKLVVAARAADEFAWAAWVFATSGADVPHAWEQPEDKMLAVAIECDDWGACTWVGTSAVDGTSRAIASKRAP